MQARASGSSAGAWMMSSCQLQQQCWCMDAEQLLVVLAQHPCGDHTRDHLDDQRDQT